jgi:hypothetical protein
MGSWHSRKTFSGDPQKVLDLLTDPDQIRAWSPIDFEIDDLENERLQTGTFVHVAGKLAGRRMSFDINVHKASEGQFILSASGPLDIEVEYGVDDPEDGDESGEIKAWVTVKSGGGIIGRIAASATDAVLAAGALEQTVKKIANAAEEED